MSHRINETLEDGFLLQEQIYFALDNIQTWLKHFASNVVQISVFSYCQLCQEPLIFACTSCDYITEEKVHTDCRNAEVLAKTAGAKEEATPTNTITASIPTVRNRKETIADKPKEEE